MFSNKPIVICLFSTSNARNLNYLVYQWCRNRKIRSPRKICEKSYGEIFLPNFREKFEDFKKFLNIPKIGRKTLLLCVRKNFENRHLGASSSGPLKRSHLISLLDLKSFRKFSVGATDVVKNPKYVTDPKISLKHN